MEVHIEKVVYKSVLEAEFECGGDKEYERQEDQKENPFANRKTMKGDAKDTLGERKLVQNDEWRKENLEERKMKLIQNAQLKKQPDRLKKSDEIKLRSACGKLEKDNGKLALLLVEADKEIPEAGRARLMEAWSNADTICLRIKQAISQKTKQNFEEYYSEAKQSLGITRSKVKLLEAILDSLKTA